MMFLTNAMKMYRLGRIALCLAGFSILPNLPVCLNAQEQFQLVAPTANASSNAEKTDRELVVRDANGGVSRYARDPRMDSADGSWIGYTSRTARQVIRWPVSNQGNMQIGTLDGSGDVRFRESKMEILPLNARRNDPILPTDRTTRDRALPQIRDVDMRNPVPLRLSNRADHQQFLSVLPSGNFSLLPQGGAATDWTMVPVANGMVRFHAQQGNRNLALRCDPRTRALSLANMANDASQLWRWHLCPGTVGAYALESVLFPGQALAFQGGNMLLQPIGFGPTQQWYPLYGNPLGFDPMFRSVSTRIEPNPPLPPANIDFVNTHSEAIFVILADNRTQGQTQTMRIPAGQKQTMQLDRDSGATLYEEQEIRTASGIWDRQQYATPIPPAAFYDVSVYEEILQSIAIDRTGKSPNPIEDVNYQPKSLGWLQLPPGQGLPENGSLDLYELGKAAKNPGAVRRIDRELLEKKKLPSEDPLRSILREFQGKRAAF